MSDVETLRDIILAHYNSDRYGWRLNPTAAAEAILASDWLRERDGTNRILGAIRLVEDADEAYTALVAGVEALADKWDRDRLTYPTSSSAEGLAAEVERVAARHAEFAVRLCGEELRALIGEPVEAEHVPGRNPGCDETGHVLGGDGS